MSCLRKENNPKYRLFIIFVYQIPRNSFWSLFGTNKPLEKYLFYSANHAEGAAVPMLLSNLQKRWCCLLFLLLLMQLHLTHMDQIKGHCDWNEFDYKERIKTRWMIWRVFISNEKLDISLHILGPGRNTSWVEFLANLHIFLNSPNLAANGINWRFLASHHGISMEQLILRRWNYDDVIENYHWHARQQQPRRHLSIFREFRYVFRLIGGGGVVAPKRSCVCQTNWLTIGYQSEWGLFRRCFVTQSQNHLVQKSQLHSILCFEYYVHAPQWSKEKNQYSRHVCKTNIYTRLIYFRLLKILIS